LLLSGLVVLRDGKVADANTSLVSGERHARRPGRPVLPGVAAAVAELPATRTAGTSPYLLAVATLPAGSYLRERGEDGRVLTVNVGIVQRPED
jgi:hypothetical protein